MLADSIAAVGLLIAFYYGLTGFACVWYYRKHLQGRSLWTKGVLPGLGGLLLLGAFIQASITYASPDGGETTVFGIGGVFVIGIGSLVLGAVLMFIYSRIAPPFFRGRDPHQGQPRPDPAAHAPVGLGPARLARGDGDRARPLEPPAGPEATGPARLTPGGVV